MLVDKDDEDLPEQTRRHVASLAPSGKDAFAAGWRDHVFIEYYYVADNKKCDGYPTEDIHNNFIGLRHMAGSEFGDTSYAEYQTGNQGNQDISFDNVDFVEHFNLEKDTWQMDNLWNKTEKATLDKLHNKLHSWFQCKGDSCP